VTTLNEAQAAEATRLLGTLRDVPDRRLSVGKLRTLEYQERRRREAEGPQGSLPASITIRHGDFRTTDWSPWEGNVSLIVADPPWAKGYAHLRKPLADLCGRLLRTGGVACIYTGHQLLGEWISELASVLTYRWVIASVNEGKPRIQYHGRGRTPIYSGWRPILVASKGELQNNRLFHDVLRHGQEKTHHEWQQPAEEARRLVEMFSKDGETVIDPCCGSGSSLLGVLQAGGGRVGVGVDVDGQAVKVASKRVAEAAKAGPGR
jgi:hypothetical protein